METGSSSSGAAAGAGGMSDGMRTLLDGYRRLHESILKIQTQIEEEEAAYLEETPHGNIIRGWDGFIDAKPPRKDATTKKVKPYTEAEHLFSSCCFYSTLASEPTPDLVDPTIVQETCSTSSRRKLSTSAAAAAASGAFGSGRTSSSSSNGATSSAAGTPIASTSSGSKLQRSASMNERKASIGSASAMGKAAGSSNSSSMNTMSTNSANSNSVAGKASKLKKRKREKLESPDSAELDDALSLAATVPFESLTSTSGAVAATGADIAAADAASAPAAAANDILDIF